MMINTGNLRATGSYAFAQTIIRKQHTLNNSVLIFFQNLQLQYLIFYFIPIHLVEVHTAYRRNSMREIIKKKIRVSC